MAFNGRFILNIADFAAQQGADPQQLIALSGQSAEQLAEESSTVTNELYDAIVTHAIVSTQDPHFGLHLGTQLSLSAAGLIGQITQTSASVKEALTYCCHFANLGCNALPMQLTKQANSYKIRWSFDPLWAHQSPTAFQQTVLGMIVFTLQEFCTLNRRIERPLAIYIPWKAPSDLAEYQRVFAAPLFFEAGEIAVELEETQVERPISSADYQLLRLLVTHAEEKTKQRSSTSSFINQIKQLVIQLAQPVYPSIEQIAAQLNLSRRSLQRRLKAEDYTFQQLTDELRQEFALDYLKHHKLSINDVAYLLGYAENSAFSRAFKRWQGLSPQLWRQQQHTSTSL